MVAAPPMNEVALALSHRMQSPLLIARVREELEEALPIAVITH